PGAARWYGGERLAHRSGFVPGGARPAGRGPPPSRGNVDPRLRRAGRPMIRYAVYLLLVTVLLALQTTWLAGAGIGGAVPNPLIILIMIVVLFIGLTECEVFGAGDGLL